MVDYTGALDKVRGNTEVNEPNPVLSQFKIITDTAVYQCWEFAEHQLQGLFLLFDFDTRRLGILAQTPYGLHDIFDLHRLEGVYRFNGDPEYLNTLREEANAYMDRAVKIFHKHHNMLPRKIWYMHDFTRMDPKTERPITKLAIDYTPRTTELLSFEDALGEWQDVLNATGWQNFLI